MRAGPARSSRPTVAALLALSLGACAPVHSSDDVAGEVAADSGPPDVGPLDRDAGSDPIAAACGGARPPLADCGPIGVYSADCGGGGEPVFACDDVSGTCRWFAGACVAAGFRASDCPATDRCCHATPDGTWPFADGWIADGTFAPFVVREDIATVGSTAITATSPANLEVTLDAAFVPSTPDGVECTGDITPSLIGLCPGLAWATRLGRTHDTFALQLRPRIVGHAIVLEIATRPDGTLLGRAFVTYVEDAFFATPPATCMDRGPRALPASGTLIVDRLVETGPVHGYLVLDVGGGTVTASF